jgi:tRNA (mo5U34)-methyltransferase
MMAFRQAEAERLRSRLGHPPLAAHADELSALFETGWNNILNHGDMARWQGGFRALPDVIPDVIPDVQNLNCPAIQIGLSDNAGLSQDKIRAALKAMHPWRKGPFDIFGVHIDAEWRSDWKWDRLQDAIMPLAGRTVLDVGCGCGYHLWRMLGADASLAIGIDPGPLFSMQFAVLKHYLPDAPAFILPCGIEQMPGAMPCFDSVFSMGVLYHRKSPVEHLLELKGLLRDGGELVLETLVIEGDKSNCLIPDGRYAKMRNVWFIPSVAMLHLWLKRCGFSNIRTIDVSITTTEEQRASEWMTFESLSDFLDSNNAGRTIEGHPAPMRAILTATG